MELLGELVLPLAEPELLLGLLAPGELAPPEAEPDFAASLEPLVPDEELDEEPGELGLELGELDDAPADGDEGELLGEVLELDELGELGVDEVLLELSPRSQAARPKASATAAASIESFMRPPRLGYRKERCKLRARPNPLIA